MQHILKEMSNRKGMLKVPTIHFEISEKIHLMAVLQVLPEYYNNLDQYKFQ